MFNLFTMCAPINYFFLCFSNLFLITGNYCDTEKQRKVGNVMGKLMTKLQGGKKKKNDQIFSSLISLSCFVEYVWFSLYALIKIGHI